MANKIRCADCRFPQVDKKASQKHWDAHECGNPKSDYHQSLLNIDVNGGMMKSVVWSGCEHGERRVGV